MAYFTVLAVSISLIVSVLSLGPVVQKPEGVSDDMYCLGCEITIKELDNLLRRKPTRGMGETVTRALTRVCDLSTFKKYEYDPKTVLNVCKQIVKDEGLEAVLITEYGRKHASGQETSYLETSKKVCGIHLHACTTQISLGNEEGGGIKYNAETEEFKIMDGKNVRKANPVRQQGGGEDPVEPVERLKLVEPEVEEMVKLESRHAHAKVAAADLHHDKHEEL